MIHIISLFTSIQLLISNYANPITLLIMEVISELLGANRHIVACMVSKLTLDIIKELCVKPFVLYK